ncbi:MAG: response regulator transcription factor [Nitrospira sp.]
MNMERIPVAVCRQTQRSEIIHVLVVDDHPLMRQGLRSLISCFSEFEILGEAADGEEACDCAQRLQPDVILMDIHMPKMNGITATRWIKEAFPHVVIIGLSVDQNSAVATQFKAAGASAYLTKETQPDELYRAIHAALTSGRASSGKAFPA